MATIPTQNSSAVVSAGKALAEKQAALLRLAEKEVQQCVKRINTLFSKAEITTLRERYKIGTEVVAIFEYAAKKKGGTYGTRLVEQYTKLFGWDRGVLYGARTIATAYSATEIDDLCARSMANGRNIPFGHVLALAKVEDRKIRKSIIIKSFAGNWTREELTAALRQLAPDAVQGPAGRGTKDGRGRPLKLPKNLPELMAQQEQATNQFVERAAVWESPGATIGQLLAKLPLTEQTDGLIRRLNTIAAGMRVLSDTALRHANVVEQTAEFLRQPTGRGNGTVCGDTVAILATSPQEVVEPTRTVLPSDMAEPASPELPNEVVELTHAELPPVVVESTSVEPSSEVAEQSPTEIQPEVTARDNTEQPPEVTEPASTEVAIADQVDEATLDVNDSTTKPCGVEGEEADTISLKPSAESDSIDMSSNGPVHRVALNDVVVNDIIGKGPTLAIQHSTYVTMLSPFFELPPITQAEYVTNAEELIESA